MLHSKKSSRAFSILNQAFGLFGSGRTGYILNSFPPSLPLSSHSIHTVHDRSKSQSLSTLPNGVRILTESEGLPSSVHLGVTITAGTRDETSKTSGLVHALSSTYLKTNIRTNEQINYGMIQMSGGQFKMTYSQDFMNYFGHCLAHDTYDIFQMLSDCVLDEKTLMDEEAAQWRIDEYWKLRDFTLTNWQRLDEVWLSAAYGFSGYGMPVSGFPSNFQNIGYASMNNWRKHYATPDRMIVWAAGIKSHDDFVKIVENYFGKLDTVKGKSRNPSQYIGGEVRELTEAQSTNICIAFQGASRNSEHLATAFVLKYIIGSGKTGSLCRATRNLREKYSGIEAVEADHAAFEDTGNFRIKLAIRNENVREVCQGLIKDLQDLDKISEEEVERAKRLLIAAVTRRGLDPCKRLVKNAQMLGYTNKLTSTEDFVKSVEIIDAGRVKALVNLLKKSFPTLVAIGGNVHDVPSAEEFHNKLR